MLEDSQKGVSLIITFFVMIIILGAVLSLSTILYSEIRMIRNIGNSVIAFYAADSGVEKVLYYDRNVLPVIGEDPETEEKIFGVRGLCNMCQYDPLTNPGACQGDPGGNSGEKGLFCDCESSESTDDYGKGCDPDKCDNCRIKFATTIDGSKRYEISATITPGSATELSASDIRSTGYYEDDVLRTIELKIFKQSPGLSGPQIMNEGISVDSVPEGMQIGFSADVFDGMGISRVIAHIYTYYEYEGGSTRIPLTDAALSKFSFDCIPSIDFCKYSGSWTGSSAGLYSVDIEACNDAPNPVCNTAEYVRDIVELPNP